MEGEPGSKAPEQAVAGEAAGADKKDPDVVEVLDEPDKPDAGQQKRPRSRSRSGSSSGSSSRSRGSSSSRSRSRSPPKEVATFVIDDSVEVFGLESEGGKFLNGRKGVVLQFIEAHGRYEVSFGPGRLATVRPENLRKCEPDPQKAPAPKAEPKAPPKSDSLASLLGLGRAEPQAEEPAQEQWKPVWERSGSAQPGGVLTEDQRQAFAELQAGEAQKEADDARLRRRVEAECARAGVLDEAMVEQVFQEQREKRDLRRLQRGRSRSRSRSRSHSSSSSSSSSGSGKREKSPGDGEPQ